MRALLVVVAIGGAACLRQVNYECTSSAFCVSGGVQGTRQTATGLAGQVVGLGVETVDFDRGGCDQVHEARPVVRRKFSAN